MAKISREDELQADRYGLQLMSRAGYDPESMVTMMAHLARLAGRPQRPAHQISPRPSGSEDSRRALAGVPRARSKDVTPTQELVQASSDEERARYYFAALRLEQVLKKDPQNAEALLELGQSQLALGLPSKSEQTLAEAAQLGSPQTRATANQRIARCARWKCSRSRLTTRTCRSCRAAVQAAQARNSPLPLRSRPAPREGKDQIKAIRTASTRCSTKFPTSAASTFAAARESRRSSRISPRCRARSTARCRTRGATPDRRRRFAREEQRDRGMLKESANIYTEMLAPFAIAADSRRFGGDVAVVSADDERALARRRRHAALGRCRPRVADDARSVARRSRRFPQTARPRPDSASTAI